jgi:hypothetical protein
MRLSTFTPVEFKKLIEDDLEYYFVHKQGKIFVCKRTDNGLQPVHPNGFNNIKDARDFLNKLTGEEPNENNN